MKILALLSLFSFLVFASCKKDYTCTCTSDTRQYTGGYNSSTVTFSYSNVTKSDAKRKCKDEETNTVMLYIHGCSL